METPIKLKMKPLALILALSVLSASGQQYVQQPKTYGFTYSLTGEEWLVVRRINDKADKDLWHPSMVLVTSTYRPFVAEHKNKDGSKVWEITFRSPNIREPDLP